MIESFAGIVYPERIVVILPYQFVAGRDRGGGVHGIAWYSGWRAWMTCWDARMFNVLAVNSRTDAVTIGRIAARCRNEQVRYAVTTSFPWRRFHKDGIMAAV